MAYWLLKTEPDVFSWDDQVKRGAKGEPWTGVRNHQAKNNLLKMKKGAPRVTSELVQQLREAVAGNFAFILVHYQHGNFARFHTSFTPAKEVAEERTANDRNKKSHEHGFPVPEKQFQVFSHESEERNHQSRRLLPVSVRNTDSSDFTPPGVTPAYKPSSVSSATTFPWSMMTMRSARRSTSSM